MKKILVLSIFLVSCSHALLTSKELEAFRNKCHANNGLYAESWNQNNVTPFCWRQIQICGFDSKQMPYEFQYVHPTTYKFDKDSLNSFRDQVVYATALHNLTCKDKE